MGRHLRTRRRWLWIWRCAWTTPPRGLHTHSRNSNYSLFCLDNFRSTARPKLQPRGWPRWSSPPDPPHSESAIRARVPHFTMSETHGRAHLQEMNKRCDNPEPQNTAEPKRHTKTNQSPLRRRERLPFAGRFIQSLLEQHLHVSLIAISP